MRAPDCAIHALKGAICAPQSAIAHQSAVFASGVPNPLVAGRNFVAGVRNPKAAVRDPRVGSAQSAFQKGQ